MCWYGTVDTVALVLVLLYCLGDSVGQICDIKVRSR